MRRLWPVLLIGLLALGAGLYGGLRWARGLLDPVDPSGAGESVVLIPAGASTLAVAEQLQAAGLIKSARAFRYYARHLALDGQLKPGEYSLSRRLSVRDILDKLVRGDVVIHRVTIPEGLTVTQMADLVAAQGVVERQAFLAAARRTELAAEWLPAGAPLKEPLEGYLFPATYEYRLGLTAEELVNMMVGRLRQALATEALERARELGLSVHQVLTLASIVEEEAASAAELPRIAGVYHNRLRRKMRLEADPTVRYATGKQPDQEITYADLEVQDPYNTYRVPGLPPGPIANPGEAALRAVLWPESHPYLFFVAKRDGSGQHIFSETYNQHLAAIRAVQTASAAAQR